MDRVWHEWEVLSETAREIVSIRREIRTIIELLERIDYTSGLEL